MAQTRVYATTYLRGAPYDNKTHDLGWFPGPVAQGDTLHYSPVPDDPEGEHSVAWKIRSVAWCPGTEHFGAVGHWHQEIVLGVA